MRTIAGLAMIVALVGCKAERREQQQPLPPAEAPQPTPAQPPAGPPAPGTPGGLPDDRTPLPEPKGEIDPKSAEAAGQVVQHFGALIEQKRFSEARTLWGSPAAAAKFESTSKAYRELHLQIGKPGGMEGAAGSIYVTVPVVFYGTDGDGRNFSRKADVILRRVNDVPGSTEAQRRWHIDKIEWSSPS